jgi:hypothetical protein
MEPYPFHYTHRSRAGDSVDPTVKFVFEERLDDRIEGRCQGIEHRMADSEQRVEERLILLEMARMESEMGRTEIEKQVEGLKLKGHHVGRFLERENLGDPQGKPGIFQVVESALPPPPHQATDADSPTGHCIEHHSRDLELGSVASHTQVPINGTSQSRPNIHVVDSSAEWVQSSVGEFARVGHGHLPKLQFPVFSGEDPQLWKSQCGNYYEMYGVEESLWVRVASMHMEGHAAC